MSRRTVTVLGASGNQWVVTDGLKDGEQILTAGFQKAGPGAAVQIAPAEGAAEAAPEAPPAAEGN